MEALTAELQTRAMQYIEHVDSLGGASKAVDYFKDEIAKASYAHQLAVESGKRPIIGVSTFREPELPQQIERPDYSALETQQRERLAALRAQRSSDEVSSALARVREAARDSGINLLPVLIDAVKTSVTLGEISDVLRGEWGVFRGVAA